MGPLKLDMPHGATERVAVAVLERVGEVERVAVTELLGDAPNDSDAVGDTVDDGVAVGAT